MINKSNIQNYSIAAVWENNPKQYAEKVANHYSDWLRRKVYELTGEYPPVSSGELQADTVLLHILNSNGAVGKIYFDGGKLVICGGRPYALAGALNHFVKLLGEGFEFGEDFYFEQEFDRAEVIEGLYPEIPNVLANPKAHRPVPTEFPMGEGGHRGEDGLVYYPMPEDAATKLSRLSGGKVIMTADELLACPVTSEGMGIYGEWSFVDVNDAPFKKAVYVNTTVLPDIEWKMNIRFYPDVEGFGKLFEDGDVMLAKIYVKLLSGGDIASGTGKVSFSFSKFWQSKRKGNGSSITTLPSDEWLVYYLPIQTTHDYIADRFVFDICPSFNIQEVFLGGFELVNFGKKYTLDDMPSTTPVYKGADEGAQWRKDALARIEKHRKGDITVIVKDSDGKAVEGAAVSLGMYEHEFNIGLNISHFTPLTRDPSPEKYRQGIVENYNSYGTGHMHRRTEDGSKQIEYDAVESCYMWAKENGCAKQLKGHALMWDMESCSTEVGENGEYISPIDYYYSNYILKNDWEGLDRDVEKHIKWLSERFPYITQWDVSNEDSSRNNGTRDWAVYKRAYIPYLRERYGDEYAEAHQYDYLINWYRYARKYFPKASLTLNDIYDAKLLKFEGVQLPFLRWAVEHLDFDAIGYQGHEGYNTDPEEVVALLDRLSEYGKAIHITEYDTNSTGGLSVTVDGDYQANLVRDTAIAYFACERVDTLYLWWQKDFHLGQINGVLMYNYDMSLKKSGMMLRELFYKHWWTNAEGRTDKCGEYSTRGFYGDYTVTVTKDGKTVSFDIPCHRGEDNTIVVTI